LVKESSGRLTSILWELLRRNAKGGVRGNNNRGAVTRVRT